MTRRPGPAVPPILQQGMTADRDSVGIQHRHPNRANGDRPKRTSKYILLVSSEHGDQAAAGTQVRGDVHGATMGA